MYQCDVIYTPWHPFCMRMLDAARMAIANAWTRRALGRFSVSRPPVAVSLRLARIILARRAGAATHLAGVQQQATAAGA